MTTIRAEDVAAFNDKGFLVVNNLFTGDECREMRDACHRLVDDLEPEKERAPAFRTSSDQKDRNDYFVTSGDKIRYFYEEAACDADGRLKHGQDKFKSINKIGHALHVLEPTFKRYTFDVRMKSLVSKLGMQRPAVCQSMYIFKQPKIGAAVPPHIDSTYLHTKPLGKVVGIWIALEDAEIDNGCLWFQPGSHKDVEAKGEVPVRFIRVKPEDFEKEGFLTKSIGQNPEYEDKDFVPVPVKAGDAIVIHGLVVHKSLPNKTDRSRHIYTYHILEQEDTEWDVENWLQPTKDMAFTPMF